MTDASTQYDTIIIGGGPAGIAAARHLAYHNRPVLIVDRKSSPMFFATTPIHNYPGVKPLQSAREIHKKMANELHEYDVPVLFGNVIEVTGQVPCFKVTVQTKKTQTNELTTKTVIFATGIARKHPKVKGEWRKWLPY